MDVISQLEDSNGNDSNHLPCISIEGTSARTRSFSFEEVMLRRKSKRVVVEPIKEEEPSQFKELPAKDGMVQTHEYSRDVPEPKRLSEDLVQGNYGKELTQEETPLDGNRQSSKPNHKTQHDGQMDAEPRHYAEKSNKDGHVSNAELDNPEVKHSEKNTRDRHAKNSRQDYNMRESNYFEDEDEQESHTKHRKDVSLKDVDMKSARRSERDRRRSHLTEKSVRIKSEIDKSGLTRHDIRKSEFEYPEKRGRRYKEFEYPENKGQRYEREFEYVENRGRRYEDFGYLEKRGRRYEEFEYPEKKGRRHESKSKKRRSKSPGYHRKRERSTSVSPRGRREHRKRSPPISPRERRVHKRRSVSVSPKARKHSSKKSPSLSPGAGKRSRQRSASTSPKRGQKISHHGHSGHGYGEESMPHSFRERSSKETSETARIKASKSGGSSRSHVSGLGGYSPRKRKTEAATKTLSPPRSPDRKVVTWDQPPVSTTVVNRSSATKSNEFPSSTPTKTTPAQSQSELPSNTPGMLLGLSIDSVQLTQATRPKRRLYIENLPNLASDKVVMEWLNDFLRSTGLSHYHANSPCISCIMNKERGQAVVEFLTPEDATAALSLNGKSFSGSILKVRRPKDFIDTAIVNAEKTPDVAEPSHAVSNVVKNSSQKVFIGGISKTLTSGMLMEIVRSFGTLKAFQFEVNEFGEPYVFLEYLDPGVTCDACASLNGMKLGGQVLTVIKAFPDLKLDEGHLENLPSNEIPTHAKPLLVKPTKVLKLTNVFNMEEFTLLPDAGLEETLEDVRIECARFGTVKSINAVHQASNDSIHVSEQNPQALLPSEIATLDGPSKTDIPSLADEATLDMQSRLEEDAVGDTSVDGDHLEKEANNPSQVEVMGDTLLNSSRDGDNEYKEIDGPSQVDVISSTFVNSNRHNDEMEKEKVVSQVDVAGSSLEDLGRDANNLESKNGSSSQPDDAERPSQVVGMVNEEQPYASEAGTPAENMQTPTENTQVSALAEVEDHKPSEIVSSSKEMKVVSLENESVYLQTASDAANLEKSHEGDEEKMLPTHDARAFEPGCILVEFTREEAACMAAHFLNRRPYDGRPVEVRYVAHDLYLEQFPR